MASLYFPGTVVPSQVLAGQTFCGNVNYNAAGTMTNNGAYNITPSGSAQAIPAGYHNGSGTVAAVSVPVANVLTGTTIAGQAGTMPNKGAVNQSLAVNGSFTIPAGYHNGSGVVSQSGVTIASLGGLQYAQLTPSTDASGNLTVSGLTFQPRSILISLYNGSYYEWFNWVDTTFFTTVGGVGLGLSAANYLGDVVENTPLAIVAYSNFSTNASGFTIKFPNITVARATAVLCIG